MTAGQVHLRAAFRLALGLLIGAPPVTVMAQSGSLESISDFRLAQAPAVPHGSSLDFLAAPALAQRETPELSRISFAPEGGGQVAQPATYGPADPVESPRDAAQFRGFGRQASAVKWEMAAILGYYTAINAKKLFRDPTAPHFQKEGWFGKSTGTVGVDKLAHFYSAYVVSEIIYARLKYKTGKAPGIALTAAALGSATMLYTELWDSIEPSGGWSWEDVTFNMLGAGFSVLRNSVPGLDRKLDFRLMIVPSSDGIHLSGKEHFEEQRHFFALKLAGFKSFSESPLRFVELHAGYYGKDFTGKDRERGIEPKRRIFVGVGINLRELFFKNSRTRVGRAAGEVLDYFQPPYTALHHHITN